MAARPPKVSEAAAGGRTETEERAKRATSVEGASGSPSELISIQLDIEATRAEIAAAVSDLERAARSLATPAHWRRAAARSYYERPGIWLAGAFLFGWWLGRRVAYVTVA